MAIVFNKYVNNKDHTWYDSTNVLYSLCYDNDTDKKNIKIIFKNGRTYLYKDVDSQDFINFKMSESTGKGVNEYITKKYKGLRLQDTDLSELENLKQEFIDDDKITDEAFTNLSYHLSVNDDTGEFLLLLNNKPIYKGIEGKVSIVNLLKSMNIHYSISGDYQNEEEDIENEKLKQ